MNTKTKNRMNGLILLTAVSFLLPGMANGQWTKHVIDEDLDDANVVYTADMDGDNNTDVVAGAYTAKDLVWYNSSGWDKNVIDANLPKSPSDIVVADMNNDGDPDVVAVLYFQAVSQILWFEAPSWTKHNITGLAMSYYNKLTVADMNGDGIPDVVSADYDDDLILWFEGPSWTAHFIDSDLNDAYDVVVADMDGDDDPDVVAIGFLENYIVWYEAPSWTKHFIQEGLDDLRCFAVADLNNDGLPDVCAATNYADTDVAVWYEAPGWTMHTIDDNRTNSSAICVADLNNDNLPDVLISGGNGNNIIWYEAPDWTKHFVDEDIEGPGDVAVADLDGDGDADIAVTNGDVIWYENGLIVGVESHKNTNSPFDLSDNYPNPFHNLTAINYKLNADRYVNLKVFDINRKEIATLVNKKQSAGEHKVTFDARGISAGVYYYRIKVGNYFQTKKLIIK